jgi:hypothetical protein
MDQDSLSGRIGTYATSSIAGETVRAYVPKRLPPKPGLDLTGLSGLVSEAMYALGRLDGVRSVAPDTSLFV